MEQNHVTFRGAAGEVRWSYHKAAALGAWTVDIVLGGVSTLTAQIINRDAYRLSQQPLVFVALRPHGSWRWPIVGELQNMDGELRASLGPQEC
jgi:hypothetical protein